MNSKRLNTFRDNQSEDQDIKDLFAFRQGLGLWARPKGRAS